MDLRITYAGEHYLDRTLGLETGAVRVEGADLNYLALPVSDIFRRMARDLEFEASEMSMSTLMVMHSQGNDALVAIPVFPSRAFRHSQVYVNAHAGVERPEDLRGRNVGVQDYQITAALWQRAFLTHDYDVAPQNISWFVGGLRVPQSGPRYPYDIPTGVTITPIAAGRTLQDMLEQGELDAVLCPRAPDPFKLRSPHVRRLFPDYRPIEEDYYRRTGFFPIMHTVVIRRDVYKANRWLAMAMLEAFSEAKREGMLRLAELDTLSVMHPWIGAEIDYLKGLFGKDPFAYGYRANEAILRAMVDYHYEQGLSTRRLDPAELFAGETLEWKEPDALMDLVLGN